MSLTIADRRVDAMQNALTLTVRALGRWKIVERDAGRPILHQDR